VGLDAVQLLLLLLREDVGVVGRAILRRARAALDLPRPRELLEELAPLVGRDQVGRDAVFDGERVDVELGAGEAAERVLGAGV
jgi:hypothetical protein